MSAITLKKKRRILFSPIEIKSVKTEALLQSGAYIIAISERDAKRNRHVGNQCIMNEAPPPPLKVHYANGELEQPLATCTMQFKFGACTFKETFTIMTQTSFCIIGLSFPRKRLTTRVNICESVRNDYPIRGTLQPFAHFDECAKLIIAPAITAGDKRVTIKIANTTVFLYTIIPNSKLGELQLLKSVTKSICPVDISALNLLTDHNDLITYVNALWPVKRRGDNEEKFWFPTPENSGNESEHLPIQKPILKELRELAKLENLDPKENEESRAQFLLMFKCSDSLITGESTIANLESTIVEFNNFFARYRLYRHEHAIQS